MERVKIFLLMSMCIVFLSSCEYKEDNIVEEIAEEIIEAELGIDIDLSPGSPERDQR